METDGTVLKKYKLGFLMVNWKPVVRCNASGIDSGELGWEKEARNISVYSRTSDS